MNVLLKIYLFMKRCFIDEIARFESTPSTWPYHLVLNIHRLLLVATRIMAVSPSSRWMVMLYPDFPKQTRLDRDACLMISISEQAVSKQYNGSIGKGIALISEIQIRTKFQHRYQARYKCRHYILRPISCRIDRKMIH